MLPPFNTLKKAMTPIEMAHDAQDALQNKTHLTLVHKGRVPKGFPRGELLCENFDGRHVYSYDPAKVLNWLSKNKAMLGTSPTAPAA